jgi:hypothetical protein
MENRDISINYNDSDVGYFEDCFVEEVKKEIRGTLLSLRMKEIKEDCVSCDVEYHDKKGVFICSNCGKEIKP